MNPLNKIGIQCNNIEKTTTFYVEVLGLKILERFPIKKQQDYVYLQSEDLIIELMPKLTTEKTKIHHLSFSSSSLRKDTDKLIGNNVVGVKEPFDVGVGKIRLAFFTDNDGVNIQLYERLKENSDSRSKSS
tara:strand:- start:204 stop:596 length:393 start_codon:yes stop_codon:yes gene_type:complete